MLGKNSALIGTNPQSPLSQNLLVALAHADSGIPVFPCLPAGKREKQPLTSHGHHAATTDYRNLCYWWRCWPHALVGMPAEQGSGVWVLDVDDKAGHHSLNKLLVRLRLATIADLTRVVSRTPSGGLHLFFRLCDGERPRNRAQDLGRGLDTRGVRLDGASAGYVIAPGSVLPDGRRYELIDAANLTKREGHP